MGRPRPLYRSLVEPTVTAGLPARFFYSGTVTAPEYSLQRMFLKDETERDHD